MSFIKNMINSPAEIDEIVTAQAADEAAWEEPIYVQQTKLTSLSIPTELATRAAFLAQLHRKKSVGEWLTHIIEERVELEEAVFAGVKRELTVQPSS